MYLIPLTWLSLPTPDPVTASLTSPAKVGDNLLTVKVVDPSGAPVNNATVTLTIEMAEMDMGTQRLTAKPAGPGTYTATLSFSMSGRWRVKVKVETPSHPPVEKTFDFEPKTGQGPMTGPMTGKLGSWSMQKEGSGTSWLPESSPMFMKMLPKSGAYDIAGMGFFTLNEGESGGKRGDSRFYSNSMLMLMATRQTGGGTLSWNLMMSLDPIFNGEYGYPDLFQTGETAYGHPLTDYQHPHNLLSEATVSYSKPVGDGLRAFVYAGPVGEPSLGGPTFMHRPSGFEIPEAPISHHWFDSTHISSGVVTVGLNSNDWQIEGSSFNGKEPGENRYWPDPISFNSGSGRITYNPTKNLSFNTSYGFLYSPETTSPGVDEHRITAAAVWSQPMHGSDNLSMTAAFGRNIRLGQDSDAILLEGTYLTGPNSIFARWEHVEKDELVGIPAGNYMINKFIVGAVRNFAEKDGFQVGLGAYAGFYIFPASLVPYYGNSPVSLGVFLRFRPSRM